MNLPPTTEYAIIPKHCVYFLKKDGKLVYIGMTRDLGGRCAQHRTKKLDFDEVRYFECASKEQAAAEEERLIRELRPPLNKRVLSGLKRGDCKTHIGITLNPLVLKMAKERVDKQDFQSLSEYIGSLIMLNILSGGSARLTMARYNFFKKYGNAR